MSRTRLLLLLLATYQVYLYYVVFFSTTYAIYWWSFQSHLVSVVQAPRLDVHVSKIYASALADPSITPQDSSTHADLMQNGSNSSSTLSQKHSGSSLGPVVPRRLHQTWKNCQVPEQWRLAQASCQRLHHDYEYKLWTDKDAEELIATKYPWFLDTYLSYPYGIQRADALRYFVLYEYGGIYIDLDIECKQRLDFLLQYDFVAPKTTPMGVSNDIMVSKKHDPFTLRLTEQLARWNKWLVIKYATVMFSTGPMFVTIQYALHRNKEGLAVLPAELYGHQCFRHIQGSSWHGSDGRLITWISHNVALFVGLVLMLPILLAVVLVYVQLKTRRRLNYPWLRKFGIERCIEPSLDIEGGNCYTTCGSPRGQHFVCGPLANAVSRVAALRRLGGGFERKMATA